MFLCCPQFFITHLFYFCNYLCVNLQILIEILSLPVLIAYGD